MNKLADYIRFLARQFRSRTAFQAGLLFGGNFTSGILRFLTTMLLAHILLPEEWGNLFVFLTVMDMVATFSDSGINPTMIKFISAESDRNTLPTITGCFIIKVAVLLLTAFALLILYKPLMTLLETPQETRWLYWAAAGAGALLSINMFQLSILQAYQRYGPFALLSTATNVVRLFTLVVLVWCNVGSRNWLYAAVFAPGIVVLPLIFGSVSRHLKGVRGRPISEISGKTLVGFMVPLALLNALTVVLMRIDVFFLDALSTDAEVGSYGLAFQVAFVFTVLTTSFSGVLLPKVAELREAAQLRAYRWQILRLYPAILVLTIVAAAAAPPAIAYVFGDKYASAASVLRVLIIAFGMHIIYNPLGLIFYSMDRPMSVTVIHLIQLPVLIALELALIPGWGGMGAAVAGLIIRVFGVIAIVVWTGQALKRLEDKS